VKKVIGIIIFLSVCLIILSVIHGRKTMRIKEENAALERDIGTVELEINRIMKAEPLSLPPLEETYKNLIAYLSHMAPIGVRLVAQGDTPLEGSIKDWKYGVKKVSVTAAYSGELRESIPFIYEIKRLFPATVENIKYTSQGPEIEISIYGKPGRSER